MNDDKQRKIKEGITKTSGKSWKFEDDHNLLLQSGFQHTVDDTVIRNISHVMSVQVVDKNSEASVQKLKFCLILSSLLFSFLFLLGFFLNVVHKKSTKHRSKTIRQWRAPTEVFRAFHSWDSSFQWYSDIFRD